VSGKMPRYGRQRGKGDGEQHGQKPRIPEPILVSLEQWMDGMDGRFC